MEEKKPKFVPNVSVSRPTKEAVKEAKPEKRTFKKRGAKKTIDPADVVASGPFALGPAKRAPAAKSTAGSRGFTKVKSEVSSSVQMETDLLMLSDEDAENIDVGFDDSDPNAPFSITNHPSYAKNEMEVDMDSLVLMQVPDILSLIISSSISNASTTSDDIKVKHESMVPETHGKKGQIGSLVIDPDGKMTLKVSDLHFDISHAPPSHIFQSLITVDGKSATDLGKVSQRMICTPQID